MYWSCTEARDGDELTPEVVKRMRVSELRVALEERALSSTGTKPILAARLLEAL